MTDWNMIKDRSIINLIIGDSYVNSTFQICMPYMSGSSIEKFGLDLGMTQSEVDFAKESRWQMMEHVIDFAIKNEKINYFFKNLLELKRFKKDFIRLKEDGILNSSTELYYDILNDFFAKINDILFFNNWYINYDIELWQFNLISTKKNITIESKKIDNVDNNYISLLKKEMELSIKNKDYESTITKGRTMLEEVMIYGIETRDEVVDNDGNIQRLYNKFKELYNMKNDKQLDKRINKLLSGLEKIIQAIAEMRNENSDAHGAGKSRIKIKDYYAILFENASLTFSEFLLSVIENYKTNNG